MTTLRKGRTALAETASFINAFPLPALPGGGFGHTVVTLDMFDDWGVKNGYLPRHVERDTLNTHRNSLRNRINNTACSEAWKSHGEEPFHIRVDQFGISYRVEQVEPAFTFKARRMPAQIRSLTTTKKDALETLLSSVDVQQLDLPTQIRIDGLHHDIGTFADRISWEAARLAQQFENLQKDLGKRLAAKAITQKNHGLSAIFDVVEESEETNEETNEEDEE